MPGTHLVKVDPVAEGKKNQQNYGQWESKYTLKYVTQYKTCSSLFLPPVIMDTSSGMLSHRLGNTVRYNMDLILGHMSHPATVDF